MEFTKESKEYKIVSKIKEKSNYNSKYNIKKSVKLKVKNSRDFSNIKEIRDDGILVLKNKELACILEFGAIDLSLTSRSEKENFFFYFKELFQINDLKLKCYKLDKKINLNPNKKNYKNLTKKFHDDEKRLKLLEQNYELINKLEEENYTISSGYYFVLIARDIDLLNKQLDELEAVINNIIPKIYLDLITNKLELYSILSNLYYSDVNLDQLMWLDLPELISPLYLQEKSNMLKIDNKEVQLISIKNISPFVDEMFFEQIFNTPKVKACININDTINTESLINVLDSSYQFLLSDRNTTKKLSDATELDTEKENFQLLMNDIKNGNEK
ncbi:MAG: hypothetical protein WCR80_03145 [Bacilli bacterium]